jgi:hypothetical protein
MYRPQMCPHICSYNLLRIFFTFAIYPRQMCRSQCVGRKCIGRKCIGRKCVPTFALITYRESFSHLLYIRGKCVGRNVSAANVSAANVSAANVSPHLLL